MPLTLDAHVMEYCDTVWCEKKLEWWGYPTVKNFEDICNRLDTMPACDRRTDILPRHSPRYAYASRGKNHRSLI